MEKTSNGHDDKDDSIKIVSQFCSYLEKSKQLFNGLRFLSILNNKYFIRSYNL